MSSSSESDRPDFTQLKDGYLSSYVAGFLQAAAISNDHKTTTSPSEHEYLQSDSSSPPHERPASSSPGHSTNPAWTEHFHSLLRLRSNYEGGHDWTLRETCIDTREALGWLEEALSDASADASYIKTLENETKVLEGDIKKLKEEPEIARLKAELAKVDSDFRGMLDINTRLLERENKRREEAATRDMARDREADLEERVEELEDEVREVRGELTGMRYKLGRANAELLRFGHRDDCTRGMVRRLVAEEIRRLAEADRPAPVAAPPRQQSHDQYEEEEEEEPTEVEDNDEPIPIHHDYGSSSDDEPPAKRIARAAPPLADPTWSKESARPRRLFESLIHSSEDQNRAPLRSKRAAQDMFAGSSSSSGKPFWLNTRRVEEESEREEELVSGGTEEDEEVVEIKLDEDAEVDVQETSKGKGRLVEAEGDDVKPGRGWKKRSAEAGRGMRKSIHGRSRTSLSARLGSRSFD